MSNPNNTIIVNLFAGPGTGKSTFCAATFAQLKWKDVDCEMALEYAKEVVWQGNLEKLKNQLYIFTKQHSRLFNLNGKLEVVITDSPILNSVIYDAKNDETLKSLIFREHNKFNNLNYFLLRKKKYNPNGRYQTFEQAKELDAQIKNMLEGNDVPFKEIVAIPKNIDIIVNDIIKKLKKQNNK